MNKIGIYDFTGVQVYAVGNSFLFLDYGENGLVMTDSQGNVTAAYRKAGEGPGELNHPIILGVDDEEILVISNARHLISFSHKLEPDPDKYAPLPDEVALAIGAGGVSGSKSGDYYFIRSGMDVKSDHAVTLLRRTGGRPYALEVAGHSFKQPNDFAGGNPTATNFQHFPRTRRLFRFLNAHGTDLDHYEVEVFSRGAGDDSNKAKTHTLAAGLQEFKPIYRKYRGFVQTAFKLGDHFYVLVQATEDAGKQPLNYLDTFAADGGFRSRRVWEEDILPCSNCPEVFSADQDNERIVPFKP